MVIRPLWNMNQALLCKCLWRLGKDSDGLWRSILIDKYKVRRNGWDMSPPSQMCCTFWKGICYIKDNFANSIRYQVCNREKISFWHDVLVVDSPLALHFPNLYRCAKNRNAKVRAYLDNRPNSGLWWPIFRRELIRGRRSSTF